MYKHLLLSKLRFFWSGEISLDVISYVWTTEIYEEYNYQKKKQNKAKDLKNQSKQCAEEPYQFNSKEETGCAGDSPPRKEKTQIEFKLLHF